MEGSSQIRLDPTEVFEMQWKGEVKHIAVEVSENGFIVGANPTTRFLTN